MARAATSTPSSSRGPIRGAMVAVAVAAVLAIAAWWWWPRAGLVPETATLAKEMLDAGGKPDRRVIRQVTSNVDRLPRQQRGELWQAVGAEWRRLRQQAIDRYVTAPAAEKPQLLDAEIARLGALRELLIALNPDADPRQPPRLPRDRGRREGPASEPADEAARKAEANRRAVAKRYEEALAAHAKSRGVVLPTFR